MIGMLQDPPFTEGELYSVYELFRPAPQARERARAMVEVLAAVAASPVQDSSDAVGTGSRSGRGLAYQPLPSVSYVGEEEIVSVDDLLALLSLQSSDLERRVERFRRQAWLGPGGAPHDDRAWTERRAEWAEWLGRRGRS